MTATLMQLEPYQEQAVTALLTRTAPIPGAVGQRGGYIKVPAGGGKTVIAAEALRRWVDHPSLYHLETPVVWLANTREQVQQAEVALERAGILQLCQVTCVAGAGDLAGAAMVVVDECHHATAPSWAKVIRSAHGATVWGLTATPERGDGSDLSAVLGPCVYEVGRGDVMDTGRIMDGVVKFHAIWPDNDLEQEVERLTLRDRRHWMDDEQEMRIRFRHTQRLGLVEYATRNDLGVEVAQREVDAGHVTLVLASTIAQCKLIAERVTGACAVYSSMGAKARRDAITRFRSGDLRCMVATSLADEGADFPIASRLIYLSAGRSPTKVEQRTGRVLRSHPERGAGLIHDFMDRQHYLLRAQSHARLKVYKRLGYRIEGEVGQ